jgi:DNA-binding MarR family transcriptional regulator
MHRRADAHFARHGVTADQFVLLGLLDERDGITQQELVCRASSDPNTIRAMLLLLEGRGLVARSRHPTDGRARNVTLTSKGRRAYAELSAGYQPFRDRIMARFEPDEAKALVDFLARISEAMTQPRGSRGRPRIAASSDAAASRVERNTPLDEGLGRQTVRQP